MTQSDNSAWSKLIDATKAVAETTDDGPDYEAAAEAREAAEDVVLTLGTPKAEVLRQVIERGNDRDAEMIRAVAGL
jgi:hypothetical protein